MNRTLLRRTGACGLLAIASFLLGGEVLPHLQVRWIGGDPAGAQANPASSASLADFVRTEPIAVAAEKGASSVVNIDTISSSRQSFGFFGEFTRTVPQKGAGSGVIISPDGYVLTNNHVIEGATKITVTLSDGKSVKGTLVGADALTDIAVVKLPGEGYPSATMGDSSKLRPGEWAIAEGNPFGTFSHTVSFGVVSAMGRKLDIGEKTYEDLLQTDAAINPGNSGGPLLDINGNVIGINTATMSSAQGISFAIPINTARNIADQLIKSGKVRRAWSGLELSDIPARGARAYHIDPKGAVVAAVEPNSPADQTGFQQGDIIRKVDGEPVTDGDTLKTYLNRKPIGSSVNLTVERGDQQQDVRMKLIEQP